MRSLQESNDSKKQATKRSQRNRKHHLNQIHRQSPSASSSDNVQRSKLKVRSQEGHIPSRRLSSCASSLQTVLRDPCNDLSRRPSIKSDSRKPQRNQQHDIGNMQGQKAANTTTKILSNADLWFQNRPQTSIASLYPQLQRSCCQGSIAEESAVTAVSNTFISESNISQATTALLHGSSHQFHDLIKAQFQQYVVERNMAAASGSQLDSGACSQLLPFPVEVQPRFQRSMECISSTQHNRNSSMQRIHDNGRQLLRTANSSPTCPLTLACPDDRGMLNDHLVFLRKQIEFFQANVDDIMSHTRGRNKGIAPQQIGVRCRHCGQTSPDQRRRGSTYFPSNLMGIYQAAQNISVEHLQSGICPDTPQEVTIALINTRASRTASSGVGKAYWAESARAQGLIDTDDGIRFAGEASARLMMLSNSSTF